jgi:hypothetical protein
VSERPEHPNQPVEPGPPPYGDPAQPVQPTPGEAPPAQPDPVEPGPPPYGDPAPPAQSADGDPPPPVFGAGPESGHATFGQPAFGQPAFGQPAFGEPGAAPKRRNPLSRGIVRVGILVVVLAVAGWFGFGGLSFLGNHDLKVPDRLAGIERNVAADITAQAEQERKDLEKSNDGAKGMVAVYGDPNAETGTFYVLQGVRGKVSDSDFAKVGISGETRKVGKSTCGQSAEGVWFCQRSSRNLSLMVAGAGESDAEKVASAVDEAWDAQ